MKASTNIRPSADETIECWDDDEDLQFNENIPFRTASSAGSVTNSFRPSGHRDSISSWRSARSDLDSNVGDEDWQVPLHDNDESAREAIASAKNAGIPIPADIPKSALVGGMIKRLSTRNANKAFVDDWSEDVELPGPDTVLQLKTPQDTFFPESLPQVSSVITSPVKSTASPSWNEDISTRLLSASATLDRFQDEKDSHGDQDIPTIKASVPRSPLKASTASPGLGLKLEAESDDFDQDLELPPDHQPLRLSHRKDHAQISSPTLDEIDLEWSEGSIGVRVGGTARDGRSIPSSSISVASPSVSSCITAESDDDGFEGLIIPDGPLDFNISLKKRRELQFDNSDEGGERKAEQSSSESDDFFSGLEIDSGKVFGPGRLPLNPNVKCKTEWPASPTRRSATTLTFTNTAGSPRTRIPRLASHDRTHSTHLETVSESGAPLSKFRRSQSRLGHSSQSSVSSLPASGTVSTSPTPATAGRRLLESRIPRDTALASDSKASGRYLKTKRSLPAIRGAQSASSTQASQRLPAHSNGPFLPLSQRPNAPVERSTGDGRPSARRLQAPFFSAGASETHSHNPNAKSYRPARRTNSDSSGGLLSPPGTFSRRSTRPEPSRASLGETNAGPIGPTSKRTLTRPTRRRNFGDGTELESFDDLPTSVSAENKFVKNPAGRGAPRSVYARSSQSRCDPPRPSPTPLSTPPSASKPLTSTPRFARDTNASRNAREQRIASMAISSKSRDTNPLTSLNSNWKAQSTSRVPPGTITLRNRKTRPVKSTPKPQLIKPIGSGVPEAKSVRGMRYNPTTFLWEGNENVVQDFDVAPKSPKPAPALISNVGSLQNVQTVGGMVFDPHRMCWLRASSLEPSARDGAVAPDEDDVFAGLDDLEDKLASDTNGRALDVSEEFNGHAARDDPSAGESSDEGPMTEEFDVGPEFIRRQRAEEEKWRRKVDRWVGFDRGVHEHHWRWVIRDLVAFDSAWGGAT
ncbi:hypothetical protein NUU61_002477 [Penicillium alfredii]|uniref:Cytokinesis regulator n=1 Tax=Penicillium alfredii TaxID=1506179 RepID=A0A9W9FRN8_9EURO|nr:uncharacterized protein NUU61_002477 [Penicillium alfredii]KAJ5105130.1 hypothetical protein NUU61_002477 [Penicillium alfredii]